MFTKLSGTYSEYSGIPRQLHPYLKIHVVNFTKSDIWSFVHASTAIICASLPTYKPLFPKMAGHL